MKSRGRGRGFHSRAKSSAYIATGKLSVRQFKFHEILSMTLFGLTFGSRLHFLLPLWQTSALLPLDARLDISFGTPEKAFSSISLSRFSRSLPLCCTLAPLISRELYQIGFAAVRLSFKQTEDDIRCSLSRDLRLFELFNSLTPSGLGQFRSKICRANCFRRLFLSPRGVTRGRLRVIYNGRINVFHFAATLSQRPIIHSSCRR